MRIFSLLCLLISFPAAVQANDLKEIGRSLLYSFGAQQIARVTQPRQATQPQEQPFYAPGLGKIAIEVAGREQVGTELAGHLANSGFTPISQRDYSSAEISRLHPDLYLRVTVTQGEGPLESQRGWFGGSGAEKQSKVLWARAVVQVCRYVDYHESVVVFATDTQGTDEGGKQRQSRSGQNSGADYRAEKSARRDVAVSDALWQAAQEVAKYVASQSYQSPARGQQSVSAQGRAMFCPGCGAKVQPAWRFCAGCSQQLSASKEYAPECITPGPDSN